MLIFVLKATLLMDHAVRLLSINSISLQWLRNLVFTTSPTFVENVKKWHGWRILWWWVKDTVMVTVAAGEGWLVGQRRQDGSVNFNSGWIDYEERFGSLTGEFWYGLWPLHCLTNQGQWKMRIDFTLIDIIKSYLLYSSFRVGPASSNYQLSISGYKGNSSGDPISSMNGMYFTTKNKDNDKWDKNCATAFVDIAGGWWYRSCSSIHTYQ